MNDDCVGPVPCGDQPVQVLMVVERVSACPIDDPRLGIMICPAVIFKLATGVQQHVADPRHRNEVLHRIAPLRKSGIGDVAHIVADVVGNGVAEADAAPLCPDLAEHGCKSDPRPVRLLAELLACQRPAERDHRPFGSHLARQARDRCRVDAGQARRPLSRFGNAVILAVEIGAKTVIAGTVACQE